MKKSVLLIGFLFLVFTLGTNLVIADNVTDLQKVNDAYDCLNDVIDQVECSNLGEEEQIFAYLATGECEDEVLDSSNNGECWPESSCDIGMTAKAIFALSKKSQDTSSSREWLLEQKIIPNNLNWYLQIESEEETSCEIYYNGNSYSIDIGEDKKIESSAGMCLSVSRNGYWLEVNNIEDCYDLSYEISCQDDFFTSLLFQNDGSQTVHVLDSTNPRTAGGTSLEKIDSFCFSSGVVCDYVDSAWATMVLDILGEDISSFIPYLVTSAEREYFPGPFLYSLTGLSEYRTDIMNEQVSDQYWRVNEDKYFDTALALLPFQGETFNEKSSAIEWLFEVQGEDGCWNNQDVRSNSFLLYSLWPRASSSIHYDDDTCEELDFFCEASGNCEETNILSEYSDTCFGSEVCCKEEHIDPSCTYELNGQVCGYNQYCDGETQYSQEGTCCLGTCKDQAPAPTQENLCEQEGGFCQIDPCENGEEDISWDYPCEYTSDYCCVPSEKTSGGYWWIWVLFILIILVIVAIIYRDKLKDFFYKVGDKGPSPPKGGSFPRRPGIPPQYNRMPQRRPPIQRKIVPQQRPVRRPVPNHKSPKELDHVLTKLKEMSN